VGVPAAAKARPGQEGFLGGAGRLIRRRIGLSLHSNARSAGESGILHGRLSSPR
jgi:hypothetical protein